MEKRTLLAVVLSLLILYVYSAMGPSPKTLPKTSQTIQNKEVAEESPRQRPLALSLAGPASEQAPAIQDQITVVETPEVLLEFSNIGGKLVSAKFKKYGHSLPVSSLFTLSGYEQAAFRLQEEKRKISYSFDEGEIGIRKVYHIENEGHLIISQITIVNEGDMSKNISPEIAAFALDMSSLDNYHDRDRALLEYSFGLEDKVVRKGSAFKFSNKEAKRESRGVRWAGFRDRYFCSVVAPDFVVSQYEIEVPNATNLNFLLTPEPVLLKPNSSKTFEARIYVGPQSLTKLAKYEGPLAEIISFSGFGLFNWVAKMFYRLLIAMHKIIPNWGACILLMSVLVYLAMYPLTAKGMASMRKMQQLQPKIAQIREQHKNNPQKMNKEIMEIYKGNRINPFGGCLPFLLQMPIFVGLYQVLWRSVELKGANFLWIKDLAEPDRLFLLPFELPFLGNEFNILPVIMMVVMFFQQRFSSRNMATADPAQATQQKIMGIVFPVFLGVIFYKFASGLCLYFTVFYILSTFTQWKMSVAAGSAK